MRIVFESARLGAPGGSAMTKFVPLAIAAKSLVASVPVPPTLTARSRATYLLGIAAPWDSAVD
jgi:hypothetical protein